MKKSLLSIILGLSILISIPTAQSNNLEKASATIGITLFALWICWATELYIGPNTNTYLRNLEGLHIDDIPKVKNVTAAKALPIVAVSLILMYLGRYEIGNGKA